MRTLLTSFCLILLLTTVGNAKIVFKSIDEGFTGMYVMDDDGSNVKLLTKKSAPHNPNWSPNGKQIVFARFSSDGGRQHFHIVIMNADGTDIRQLTKPEIGSDYYPSFSRDGKQVLFTRYENKINKRSINILDLESGEIIEIANLNKASLRYPTWSPDGRKIVFSTDQFAEDSYNLWIIDADGKNARQLLPAQEGVTKIVQSRPRWSPDGQQILYSQDEYIDQQVGKVVAEIHKAHRYMICDQNGENIRELDIPKDWFPVGLDWMDDGESVLLSMRKIELNKLDFVEDLDYHIYKYHIDTKILTELTNPLVDGYDVDWISGSALSVFLKDKKQTQWGEIKKDISRSR